MKKFLIAFFAVLMISTPLFAGGSFVQHATIAGGVAGAILGGVGGFVASSIIIVVVAKKGTNAEKQQKTQKKSDSAVEPNIVSQLGRRNLVVGSIIVSIVVLGGIGLLIGHTIGYVASNIDSEFINVVTKFSYSQSGSDRIETITYGAEGSEDAGQYFVPDFNIGQDVILNIEMTPSLTESAYYVKDKLKNERVRIPVQITISNAINITVSKDSGVGGMVTPEYDLQGNATYSFDIANEEVPKTVRFRFTPSGEDSATVSVKYGESDNPITTKDSDIFATIRFREM